MEVLLYVYANQNPYLKQSRGAFWIQHTEKNDHY